jgi:hypothetical protein
MNKTKEIVQPDRLLYADVDLNKNISDIRSNTYGQSFGTVGGICKQYGIKYRNVGNCIEFSAPKLRMQLFIEKLHFSRTKYSYKPF